MIAFDVASNGADTAASPLAWNHTVTGANCVLVVVVHCQASASLPSCSAVTFNGVAMTKARADTNSGSIDKIETSIWLLHNPATGTHSISASFSGGTSPRATGEATSYTGCKQTSTADAHNGGSGTSTGDKTVAVTTIANNCWVVGGGMAIAGGSPSVAADQTSRASSTLGASDAGATRIEDLNGVKTPAGSQTMGFTMGGTTFRAYSMSFVSIAPLVAQGGGFFRMMGR